MKAHLHRLSFLEFIDTLISEENAVRRINGKGFDQTRSRAYYRWREESSTPEFFSADRWLSFFGIHIDDYFIFCHHHELDPWKDGEPEWHALPSSVDR